jgi:catechol 2,3-dioxygenase-like lactoylglutathione lyase family enzyme
MTMNLLLKCGRVEDAKAFYSDILGFEVCDSAEGTCTVQRKEEPSFFPMPIFGRVLLVAPAPSTSS